MLRGELYRASDPELLAARIRARRLWRRLNDADPADTAGRVVLPFRRLFVVARKPQGVPVS